MCAHAKAQVPYAMTPNPGPLHTACGILAGEEMEQSVSTIIEIRYNSSPSGKFRVSCDLCIEKHPWVIKIYV